MGFGNFNKQLFVNVSLKAESCVINPHDVPNGKGMAPKCIQYVVAKTLLSVTTQLCKTNDLST
jgi:hypothetical protein